MKASFSALSGLAFAAVLGTIALAGCGGGGASHAVPAANPPAAQQPTSGSVPISSLNVWQSASSTPVKITSTTPAGPTVDVADRAPVAVNGTMSAAAAGAMTLIGQHAYTGTLANHSTSSAKRSTSTVAVNAPYDLSYHGDYVLGSAVSHPLFVNYTQATRQSLNFAPGKLIYDLNNDQFITLLYQYLTGPGTAVANPVTGNYPKGVGTELTDTYQASPWSTSNSYYGERKIALAVLSAAANNGGLSGLGHIYHVFLPKNVDTCMENLGTGTPTSSCYSPDHTSTFAFCAYHSAFFSGPNIYLFTVEPYQDTPGCQNNVYNQALPNAVGNDDPADPGYSTLSHELFETISDPLLDAWWNQFSGGEEMADICAEFDNFVTLNGNNYVLQSEYSDVDHECVSANLTNGIQSQTPQSAHRSVH